MRILSAFLLSAACAAHVAISIALAEAVTHSPSNDQL